MGVLIEKTHSTLATLLFSPITNHARNIILTEATHFVDKVDILIP